MSSRNLRQDHSWSDEPPPAQRARCTVHHALPTQRPKAPHTGRAGQDTSGIHASIPSPSPHLLNLRSPAPELGAPRRPWRLANSTPPTTRDAASRTAAATRLDCEAEVAWLDADTHSLIVDKTAEHAHKYQQAVQTCCPGTDKPGQTTDIMNTKQRQAPSAHLRCRCPPQRPCSARRRCCCRCPSCLGWRRRWLAPAQWMCCKGGGTWRRGDIFYDRPTNTHTQRVLLAGRCRQRGTASAPLAPALALWLRATHTHPHLKLLPSRNTLTRVLAAVR